VQKEKLAGLYLGSNVRLALDVRGQLVILFPDQWAVDYFVKEQPAYTLHTVSPHATGRE
jgi:hypothetical protein